jgi:hypothetical protein
MEASHDLRVGGSPAISSPCRDRTGLSSLSLVVAAFAWLPQTRVHILVLWQSTQARPLLSVPRMAWSRTVRWALRSGNLVLSLVEYLAPPQPRCDNSRKLAKTPYADLLPCGQSKQRPGASRNFFVGAWQPAQFTAVCASRRAGLVMRD